MAPAPQLSDAHSAATPLGPLLAFDTSGPTARVAIVDESGRCLHKAEQVSDRHSGTLLPLCHNLLGRTGITVADLAGVACGGGPGSFTGLRVGLAVAKGLALACDLPLLVVPSLAALAVDLAQVPGDQLLAPAIDAGKGEIYVQLFQRPAGAGVPQATTAELRVVPAAFVAQLRAEGLSALLGGTGVDRHLALLTEAAGAAAVYARFPGPSAESIALLARARLARGERDDLDAAVPVYGRPPDITTPKRPPIATG